MELRSIFIQKEVLALGFSWQLSEGFNNNIFKEKKKHCYKKKRIVIRRKLCYKETWMRYLSQI